MKLTAHQEKLLRRRVPRLNPEAAHLLDHIRDGRLFDPDGRELSNEETRNVLRSTKHASKTGRQRPFLVASKKGRNCRIQAGH